MSFGKFRDEKDMPSTPSTVAGAPTPAFAGGAGKAEAFLGRGSKVVGTLTFTGPVELDGNIEGEIHSKETLLIGEGAIINAKILGAEIVIKGTVTGDIVATKKLSLRKPARVTGNISSPAISIDEGVHFEGKCSMSANAAAPGDTKSMPRAVGAGA
jgi:cytoskeletal protein CcmA (bactofilin family)